MSSNKNITGNNSHLYNSICHNISVMNIVMVLQSPLYLQPVYPNQVEDFFVM